MLSLGLLFFVLPAANPSSGVWEAQAFMASPRCIHGMGASDLALYVVGGVSTVTIDDPGLDTVEYSLLLPGGSIDAWQESTPLNQARAFNSVATTTTHIYTLGGTTTLSLSAIIDSVEYAEILGDGSLGPWTFTSSLNIPRFSAVAWSHAGHLYVAGGGDTPLATPTDTVERAPILADGSLGDWEVLPQLMIVGREGAAGVAIDDRIFITGGNGIGGATASTEWAPIFPDGSLGAWQPGPPLGAGRWNHAMATTQGQILVVGGVTTNDTLEAEFSCLDNGTFIPWSAGPALPEFREGCAAASSGDSFHVSGGLTFTDPSTLEVTRSTLRLPLNPPVTFVRGDCNSDGNLDLSDPIAILGYAFGPDPEPTCLAACDANADASVGLVDAIGLLATLFSGGFPPPPPFPECGEGNVGGLNCGAFDACP